MDYIYLTMDTGQSKLARVTVEMSKWSLVCRILAYYGDNDENRPYRTLTVADITSCYNGVLIPLHWSHSLLVLITRDSG